MKPGCLCDADKKRTKRGRKSVKCGRRVRQGEDVATLHELR